LDWYTSALEIIDFRSFTSIWYWIVVAVVWSTTAHWTLGIPFDSVTRARRSDGGEAQDDLEIMVRVNCARIVHIMDFSGIWVVGFAFFALTALAALGFGYRVEFAQAVFLIGAPWTLVAMFSARNARALLLAGTEGSALRSRLGRLRFYNQLIGLVAIFITAFWGMWHNLSSTVL